MCQINDEEVELTKQNRFDYFNSCAGRFDQY